MNKLLAFSALAAAGLLTNYACSDRLSSVRYTIHSEKIAEPMRIVHLSDLHSTPYGLNENQLIDTIDRFSPNIICMTGDMIDNRFPSNAAYILAGNLAKKYPCYAVTGNHTFYRGEAFTSEILHRMTARGIHILRGSSITIHVRHNRIQMAGLDDPYMPVDHQGRIWEEQYETIKSKAAKNDFSLLLSHRPEMVDYYRNTEYNLILSGHAHGGQIRLPGIINGLYAPHQGFFPSYAGGCFPLKPHQHLIVSRGLSLYVKPRVFNRPEIVVIDILPDRSR